MRNFLIYAFLSALLFGGFLYFFSDSRDTRRSSDASVAAIFPLSHDPERLDAIGEEQCLACHADIVESWSHSHHAKANRPVNPDVDDPVFEAGDELTVASRRYDFHKKGSELVMSVYREGEEPVDHPFVGVIAYDPLIQYLSPAEGGRFQTASAAYDPKAKEWFYVFDDVREPGEWGHWQGQGMNWNANCAYCHMTDYEKNYDPISHSYDSQWLRQGISCVQCHGGVEAHLRDPEQLPNTLLGHREGNEKLIESSCASCHSRRQQLTPDEFKPGERYEDHFTLTLPVHAGVYYPDGQIRDEVFVYASFEHSRMGHAGISCLDCHDPHNAGLVLPITNNALCLQCHSSGKDNAPIIEPMEHSHHAADSTGNRCVECHMPETTYMQRDPRRDHGFHSPDPWLTEQFGVPNACNRCHENETVAWAREHAEAWYGERLTEHRQRSRATVLDAVYRGALEDPLALVELTESEDIPAWIATYAEIMGRYIGNPQVSALLKELVKHESSRVREKAIGSLVSDPDALNIAREGLQDPSRDVRIASAGVFAESGQPIPVPDVAKEWERFLTFTADTPQGSLMLALTKLEAGDQALARQLVEQAVDFDANNPLLLQRAAVAMSRAGDTRRAQAFLKRALQNDPDNAEVLYSLGLASAELGELPASAVYLEKVTELQPENYRAWYNLALAHSQLENWPQAFDAIRMAAPGLARSPSWQQAFMAIQEQMKRLQSQPQEGQQ